MIMAKTFENIEEFNAITINLASPETIKEWSYGEVTRPETINYRTGRSERGGLFDERIFGPEKDYECYCGKYRRIRYKDIICEKCGVEVTRSIVRRERMGHIELATPVSHIWFLRGVPSRLSIILGIPVNDLEKVIYFAGYIVLKVNVEEKKNILENLGHEYKMKLKGAADEETKEKLKTLFNNAKKEIGEIYEGKVLSESQFRSFSLKYGTVFEAGIGGDAIYMVLKNLNLEKLRLDLVASLEKATTVEKDKIGRRLSLVRAMSNANLRPEWMFMTVIPIIPPALRPMVALDGGRHATSDLNDLYRRVINRNNRLKKLKDLFAPDVILRNEKRILQEAVDALIDNSITSGGESQAMSQAQRRALKSLADNLKGKQGLFRQNLLGKRVDYSGRSVIVVGPTLNLDQCGLPKHMALELFRPFVIAGILKRELAYNVRGANKLIEERIAEVWAILEEVIKEKYVLLNRAPTLHRLGIQAFKPVLIEGNAIQVHPLVCTAFNADFDGDMMAVYVPLSKEAQSEAKELMAANKNLLKPASGDPIVNPKLDIVLGCYWMTRVMDKDKGEGKYFSSPNHAITAYDFDDVSLRARIKVLPTDRSKYKKFEGKIFETSVGRLFFNSILPEEFPYINEEINLKRMSALVDELILHFGIDGTPKVLDKIKNFGYRYATKSGISWSIDNITVPDGKKVIVAKGRIEAEEIISHFQEGLLSSDEKYRKTLEIWEKVKNDIEKLIPPTLDPNGSVYHLLSSGARGSLNNLTQMAGMKGMIQGPTGRIIDFPIIPSYMEGLSPIEYFISTHGSRKGLADTALNTARAGYLTRRLVDVAQDVVITEEDCGTTEGKWISKDNISGIEIPLAKNVRGRFLAADLKDSKGKVVYKKDFLITKEEAQNVEALGVEKVYVRSPLTCETAHGLCQKCYGLDLGRNHLVQLGEAVGIVAAQAIGEPGTQLTLRTFHAGGVATVDITAGLPRVEEIFERRMIKKPAAISEVDGVVIEIQNTGKEKTIVILPNDPLHQSLPPKAKLTKGGGEASKSAKKIKVEYPLPYRMEPRVKVGEKVVKGQILSDGSADISQLFKHGSKGVAEEYIIREILKVYELQGASISRKHIEIIVRQMFSRRKIRDAGDTLFSLGDTIELTELIQENERTLAKGGKEARGEAVVLGITETSLTTKSWLSAASFQNTNRTLINNAIRGGTDDLRGLKENVIIGRLIPAGTGFVIKKKKK